MSIFLRSAVLLERELVYAIFANVRASFFSEKS